MFVQVAAMHEESEGMHLGVNSEALVNPGFVSALRSLTCELNRWSNYADLSCQLSSVSHAIQPAWSASSHQQAVGIVAHQPC